MNRTLCTYYILHTYIHYILYVCTLYIYIYIYIWTLNIRQYVKKKNHGIPSDVVPSNEWIKKKRSKRKTQRKIKTKWTSHLAIYANLCAACGGVDLSTWFGTYTSKCGIANIMAAKTTNRKLYSNRMQVDYKFRIKDLLLYNLAEQAVNYNNYCIIFDCNRFSTQNVSDWRMGYDIWVRLPPSVP